MREQKPDLTTVAARQAALAALCAFLVSGCSPVLRDDYMGRDWVQGQRRLPDVSRDQRGEANGEKTEVMEAGKPVPRDELGNPILD